MEAGSDLEPGGTSGPAPADWLLPTGTVTFLFTDIEGSTKLLHELGGEAYAEALAKHRRLLREAFSRHGGVEVDTQGDAFFVAFPTAAGAVDAAREATEALANGPIGVRMGIHTGTPAVTVEGYVGADVHRAARIAAAGHGGQVLVSAAAAGLLDTTELRDLGEHRLKDLSAPERIYQLGDREFPPLKSLHQTNLPVPTTAFLGREPEVGEVSGLLRRDDVRIVTLTGPGGTGKTRLALQAAGAVGDAFEGGTWWVPLAAIRDAQLVIAEAARAVGAQSDLADHIGDRPTLILFDNFEQVTAAAADVASLLARCATLKVLVTSREALRIGGEWEYGVDPLREAEAVELFMTRAFAAQRDFSANGEVRQICRRLDNLPLAIELAAARVKLLSAKTLLERLQERLPLLASGARDAPERQRTLRATIEWSHELLAPDEQRLFARLSVFRGGWTLDAAEQVVAAELDTLQSLIDKSLVRQRDDRFSMLETIREYAAERLQAFGEADAIRRRHAEFFLALAEQAEPALRGGDPGPVLGTLQAQHDNLRAALDRLTAARDGEAAQRLAGALHRFWYMHGHLTEGRRRLDQALSLSERATIGRARALTGAAVMAFNLAQDDESRSFTEQARDLCARLGDEAGVAYALMMLGNLADGAGDRTAARELYRQSIDAFTRAGDDDRVGIARDNLAHVLMELCELDEARTLLEASLRMARARGDRRLEAMTLGGLGGVARRAGEPHRALEFFRDGLAYWYELGAPQFVAREIAAVARAFALLGRAEDAALLLGRSMALYEEIGAVDPVENEFSRETLVLINTALDPATAQRALAAGRALALDDAVRLALEDVPANSTAQQDLV